MMTFHGHDEKWYIIARMSIQSNAGDISHTIPVRSSAQRPGAYHSATAATDRTRFRASKGRSCSAPPLPRTGFRS